jgi:hypothetical protein
VEAGSAPFEIAESTALGTKVSRVRVDAITGRSRRSFHCTDVVGSCAAPAARRSHPPRVPEQWGVALGQKAKYDFSITSADQADRVVGLVCQPEFTGPLNPAFSLQKQTLPGIEQWPRGDGTVGKRRFDCGV